MKKIKKAEEIFKVDTLTLTPRERDVYAVGWIAGKYETLAYLKKKKKKAKAKAKKKEEGRNDH